MVLASRKPSSLRDVPSSVDVPARVTYRPDANSRQSGGGSRNSFRSAHGVSLSWSQRLERVQAGGINFLVHTLVLPSTESEDIEHFDAQVEEIAMEVAAAYEERFGAVVQNVSTPVLARQAGLLNWPGFDLLSIRPDGERRGIEVKGRSRYGNINISDNEWSVACNRRDGYWLYVVYNCATPQPRLMRVRDPFGKLIANSRDFKSYTVSSGAIYAASE